MLLATCERETGLVQATFRQQLCQPAEEIDNKIWRAGRGPEYPCSLQLALRDIAPAGFGVARDAGIPQTLVDILSVCTFPIK